MVSSTYYHIAAVILLVLCISSAANRKRRKCLPILYFTYIRFMSPAVAVFFLRRFKGLAVETNSPRKTDVCDFLSVYYGAAGSACGSSRYRYIYIHITGRLATQR